MALIACPECGHEVSTTADICPNCGHPFVKPAVQRNVVVSEVPRESDGFPPWAFVPLGILAVVLIFLLFYFMRSNDETANSNISVNVAAKRPVNDTRETTVHSETQPNEVVVPPSSEPQQVIVPPSAPPPSDTTITSIAPDTVASDKGTVSIEAKVATKSGSIQPVNDEKFYLLDEDLQSVLSGADIIDETGQGLKTAFALSVIYPDKYSETHRKALNAINDHVKYDVMTDASGKAQMKNVKPGSYYLFGIHKTPNGYALWSQPVAIQPGDNKLLLSPMPMTEVSR